MAYRAEIEIGVRGLRQLSDFKAQVERLSNEVDRVNKKKFDIGNLSTYREVLRKTNETLGDTQIQLDKAGNAVGLYKRNLDAYVTALTTSNAAQEITNRLIEKELENRGAATQALKAYNAEAAAPTQRGALTTTAGAYLRGQPKFGPEVSPEFDPVAAASRARASQLAAESIARGKKAKQDLDLVNEVADKQREIQRRALIDITNTKIDFIQKQIDAEIDGIQRVLDRSIAADKEEQDRWDRRLKAREIATKKANDAEATQRIEAEKRIATLRKEAARSIQKLEQAAIRKREDRIRRRKDAVGSAIIGGAFPLLFGQGAGAAVGGGLGGLAGGAIGGQFGFGLSLVGTQLGTIFDQTIAGAADLGKALSPLTADLDKIAEAAGFAGTETQTYIKAIEKNAGKQAALRAATQQLALTVGTEGVTALKEFGEASRDLGNSWNQLMAQMSAGLAELLKTPTRAIADALSEDAALQAGLRQTEGVIGQRAEEFRGLRARAGKVQSGQQVKDNQRLRDLRREIVALVRQENDELKKTLEATEKQQKELQKIKDSQSQKQTILEILDITERASQTSTEAVQFRERALEITTRQEERIASLRRSLEQQVASLRLQNLSREAQLRNQQESLELARLRNRLNEASSLFATSIRLDDPARKFKISLNEAAKSFNLALATAEIERSKNNRKRQLELERISLQAAQTRANISLQVQKINLDTSKQVAKLEKEIGDYNTKVSQGKFEIEKQITQLQLDRIEAETALLRLRFQAEGQISKESAEYFDKITSIVKTARKAVEDQEAPGAVGAPRTGVAGGVSFAQFNAVISDAQSLIEQLSQVQGQFIDERLVAATREFTNDIRTQTQALIEQKTPLDERLENIQQTKEVARLVAEGFSETDATQIVKGTQAFEQLNQQLVSSKIELQSYLDSFLALEEKTPAVAEAIRALQEAIRGVDESLGKTKTQSEFFISTFQKTSKLDDYIEELDKSLTDTEAQAIRVADGISNAIGNALNTAITGLIEGSTTIKEVFADLLKSVGQVLVQEGTKMIATYIAIGIARAFAGLSNGDAGSGKFAERSNKIFDGSSLYGQAPIPFKANGGPVQSGQPYMVGERGPELFVPSANGGVMRNEDMRSLMGRSPVGNAPQMSFTFETTNIGGQEFVSREQLEAAMATTRRQAANDGAKRGMNMTLDKMQNSPRTRSRIGIS